MLLATGLYIMTCLMQHRSLKEGLQHCASACQHQGALFVECAAYSSILRHAAGPTYTRNLEMAVATTCVHASAQAWLFGDTPQRPHVTICPGLCFHMLLLAATGDFRWQSRQKQAGNTNVMLAMRAMQQQACSTRRTGLSLQTLASARCLCVQPRCTGLQQRSSRPFRTTGKLADCMTTYIRLTSGR